MPESTPYAQTLGGGSADCGAQSTGGGRGLIGHRPTHLSGGVEVSIANRQARKRMSVNSGVWILLMRKIPNGRNTTEKLKFNLSLLTLVIAENTLLGVFEYFTRVLRIQTLA